MKRFIKFLIGASIFPAFLFTLYIVGSKFGSEGILVFLIAAVCVGHGIFFAYGDD